jgi:spore maturation protein CgeB
MDPYPANLAALERKSPATARRIEAAAGQASDAFSVATASDGSAVVLQDGRPLDSRRDPRGSARRLAADTHETRVVVLGLGTGYFAEALLEAGVALAAIVDSHPGRVLAAMRARDISRLLDSVPLVLADVLADPFELTSLKATAGGLAIHGASVTGDEALGAVARTWAQVRVAGRPPRVMVVGPVYGGSLETARSTARALMNVGAETRFLDFAPFAPGWDSLSRLGIAAEGRQHLQAQFAEVLGDAVLQEAAAWRPDLVLALAQAPLGVRVLGQLRARGVRTALWFVENFRVLPYWKQVAAAYDHFFAIQPEPFLAELTGAGSRHAVYLPTACDRAQHVPVDLSDEERTRFGADVSFAGAPYLNRRRLLSAVADFNLRLWGDGWERTELARCAADGGRRFSLPEMVRIFSASRVNLNIHSASHVEGLDPDADYVNPRTFELCACGAFQLVDERDRLRQLFAADELVTFRTIAQLRALIEHYLGHEDERRAVAMKGRARALAEHTFEHRVQTIMKETLPAELVAAARVGLKRESLDEAIRGAAGEARMSPREAALRALKELEAAR